MRSSKANIGSLSSMANKVRQEKKNGVSAKAKAPLARAREAQKPFKGVGAADASSSDSDSSSNSDAGSNSDSDDDLDAARAKFLATKAAKQQKTGAAKVNGAKPGATPAKPVVKASIPTSAQKPADASPGSGSESDTESESETSNSGSPSSGRKQVAGQNKSSASKAKPGSPSESTSTSGSDSDSSSDDEDMPSTGAPVNKEAPVQTAAAIAEAQESSSETSDSGSESDDEGDGGKTAMTRTNRKDAAQEPSSQISRPQWLNNSDFTLRKASPNNPGKEVADFFSNANLEGKQVWYFTAPASLPITVLKDIEIDLSKAIQGGSLLTHNGDNYGLDLESYATNTQIQLLIPSSGGDKYTSLNHGIDSTVHLRRMAKFGPGGEVHATATDNYIPVPRPIREQPEGLKVRYTPIGVPSPAVSATPPTGASSAKTSSSQKKAKSPVQSSSSESESESGSDIEMTTPPPAIAPGNSTKSATSKMTNGDRKRKHSGDEDLTTKRLKAEKATEAVSAKKRTPAQTLNSSTTSTATPTKTPSTKTKDRKEQAKKEKTPKSTAKTPVTAKQTPIPPPTIPGMRP
ncbi:DNA-directed RNA polymerase I subunit RPA34.5-domain-containing protein [Xylaria palmicola]|nr:DNA-directed RNA polymerase I subunit RPA34.5-domain-containing protein [Xylaria palmicola]